LTRSNGATFGAVPRWKFPRGAGDCAIKLFTAPRIGRRAVALIRQNRVICRAGTRTMTEPTRTRPFAPFEWMVSVRYLRARRKEGFISVLAGFSFLGIMLGVATLIIVMAVMNGFRKELLGKILGLNGHLSVQPLETPLTDWEQVSDRISQIPGIVLA